MTYEFPQDPAITQATHYHNEALTVQQAAELNEHFNFVVVGTLHGQAGAKEKHFRPQPVFYNLNRIITQCLNPENGDALFIEGFGHDGTTDVQTAAYFAPSEIEAMAKISAIDTIDYAASFAVQRGVRTEPGDIHRDVKNAFLRHHGVDTFADLTRSGGDAVHAFHELRNGQVVNTAKDDALAHLDVVRQSGRKATYLTLVGEGHVRKMYPGKTIPELYADLGLRVDTLQVSDMALALQGLAVVADTVLAAVVASSSGIAR